MTAVNLLIHLHLAPVLANVRLFDIGKHLDYQDVEATENMVKQVARQCIHPFVTLTKAMNKAYGKDFRFGLSVSGITLDLLKTHEPKALEAIAEMVNDHGNVEMLGQSYSHGLSFMYQREAFTQQLQLQNELLKEVFGQKPAVFLSTEGIYGNPMGFLMSQLGYKGIILKTLVPHVPWSQVHQMYHPIHVPELALMFEDSGLGQSIQSASKDGLRAETMASWMGEIQDGVATVCINMLEFGYLQGSRSGIFDFFRHLPSHLLKISGVQFGTPSDCIKEFSERSPFNANQFLSKLGNTEAWNGNSLQQEALWKLHQLGNAIDPADKALYNAWLQLHCSDFFYAMRQENEAYLDVYSNFLNILADLELKIG